MNHMVIGMGEVGKAIFDVLSCGVDYKVGWQDVRSCEVPFNGRAHALHVAIPDSPNFVSNVRRYIDAYNPSIVIVHSTVPVGTCDANDWIHSPIRGVHPNIARGIMTFVKYFGGLRSDEAAEIFSELGVNTVAIPMARDCEAAKLWDTTQYGWMIVLAKAIHAWCEANNADFDFVYREFNRSYNEGYHAMGRPEVARPFLRHVPGPIGGHCVIPNLPLLGKNEITNFIEAFDRNMIIEDLRVSGEQQ